jgi:hypothetical protein
MNNRERFNNMLAFQPVDRGFNHELGLWGQTLDRWHAEGLPEDVYIGDFIQGCEYFGLDRIYYLPIRCVEMLPAFEEETLEEDERYVTMRFADGHISKALKEGTAHGTRMSMDQNLSFPVQSREDWEDIKRRYDPCSPARYPEWWSDITRSLAGREYPVATLGNGTFGLYSFLRRLMGTETACTLFYDDPVLAEDMLEYLTEYLMTLVKRAVTAPGVQPDYFNYFEDFSYVAGPLVGPKLFRKFLLPRYRRINDYLHSHGVKNIWLDSDGNSEILIPLFLEAGINVHWPLERVSNMDPLKLRKEYGHDLALAGGIDKRALAVSKQAIDAELYHHVPQLLEDGGYIPCLDHTAPPDIPYENWLYYLEQKRKLLGM